MRSGRSWKRLACIEFLSKGVIESLAPMLKPDRQQEAIPSSMKIEEGGSREVISRWILNGF